MRRLRVLGALVAAIMAARQLWTSATEASSSRKASCGQAEAEELDEAQDIAAVGALGMRAGAAGDPALEQFGDAAIEAFGAGADLRGQVTGQDGRQFIGRAQDDQVTLVGHGVVVRVRNRLICWPLFHTIFRRRRRGSCSDPGSPCPALSGTYD